MEIWKDIPNYENVYQVSTLGRVRSVERHIPVNGGLKYLPSVIRVTKPDKQGYHQVNLSYCGNVKTWKVCKLVALAHIPNPNNYKCVNHKDEIKSNDCVENLEWATHKQNTNYGTCIQRRSQKTRKPVICLYPNGDIKKYDKLTDVIFDGFSISAVSQCCNGKQKLHLGCRWEFGN